MKKERVDKKFYIDWFSVAPGVWGIKDVFVNMYLIHNPVDKTWVLVDAGLKSSAPKIRKVAEKLFWPETAPSAIVLTHAHFDHVGSLNTLAEEWNVPIYAHAMEQPYLTGKSSYPPPDPTVGGGLMSLLSFSYPKGPIDIGNKLQLLPEDGSIPGLPEWTYIHTPGHAPGHISLFRKHDGVLIVGDAFVTTKQESALCVMMQSRELSGPPKYFTYNWISAAESVRKLNALKPQIAATGHGKPMEGRELQQSLQKLTDNFSTQAVPESGRYVGDPALVNKEGVQYVPPSNTNGLVLKAVAFTTAAVVTILLLKAKTQKRKRFSLLNRLTH